MVKKTANAHRSMQPTLPNITVRAPALPECVPLMGNYDPILSFKLMKVPVEFRAMAWTFLQTLKVHPACN